jgi:dephospho-CoA kinase
MLKIGLTGGMGSGKSTVAKIFEHLQIPVFYADIEAKKCYYNQNVIQAIEAIVERKITDNNRNLLTQVLSEVIFNDKEKLQLVNQVIHPLVQKDFELFCEKHVNAPVIVKEAAILFESGSYKTVDKVITVEATMVLRLSRIKQRSGLSESAILSRMQHQWSEEERKQKADFVINNNKNDFLMPQVIDILNNLDYENPNRRAT